MDSLVDLVYTKSGGLIKVDEIIRTENLIQE